MDVEGNKFSKFREIKIWPEIILEKIPLHKVISSILIGLVLFFIGAVIVLLTGGFWQFLDFLIRSIATRFLSIGIAFAFIIFYYFMQLGRNALIRLQTIVKMSDEEYSFFIIKSVKVLTNKYYCFLASIPYLLLYVSTIVFVPSVFGIFYQMSPFGPSSPALILYSIILASFASLLLGFGTLGILTIIWVAYEYGKLPLDLSPFNVSGINAVRYAVNQGLFMILAWFLGVAIVSPIASVLITVERSFLVGLFSTILLVLLGILGFFLPQLNVHNAMVKAKKALIENTTGELLEFRDKIWNEEDLTKVSIYKQRFEVQKAILDEIKDAPEWPFRYETLLKLFGAAALPIVTFILQFYLIALFLS